MSIRYHRDQAMGGGGALEVFGDDVFMRILRFARVPVAHDREMLNFQACVI